MTTLLNGAVLQDRRYYAYGNKRSGSDFAFEQEYTGQRRDATGLLYYNARYYDPALGQFISPDSLIPDPTDYFSYNRYAYARGNPLKYHDPTGHVVETLWDAANIGIGFASLGYNLYHGNWEDAAWDAGGLIVDVGATALPFIPGGAATVIRAGRAANTAINVVQTANQVQNAFQVVRVGEQVVDTTSLLAQHFDRAAEFGIGTADALRAAAKGQDLQVHHIVEKRFADMLGMDEGDMLSVVLKPTEHQRFTNAWRTAIGYSN